jgi:cyclopropane fatty-acyl-phospholipid synthase-like methyltransferase
MDKSKNWIEFWKKYGQDSKGNSEQEQVLRTINKSPISNELWEFTLGKLAEQIEPNIDDSLLELCCGNGLISRYFSSTCKKITSVDISENLITMIDSKKYPNINTQISDIRDIVFPDHHFTKIIIYAGIQYLTLAEATNLVEKVFQWLKPGGYFYLGDIPNYKKLWEFYNSSERKAIYFQNIKEKKSIVGTWFEPNFFKYLSEFVGFKKSFYLPQHPDLIYSNYRYDYKLIK